MNIQIFGLRKSFDTKKAERWFKERRIKYQYIDLATKGLSAGEYRSVRATTALPHLGQTYPKLLVSSIKSTSLSLFQVIWSQYTPSCRIFPVPVFFWA